MELGIGEALVSTLDAKGQPTMVQRTLVRPPNSRVGPITEAERRAVIDTSPVEVYDEAEERDRPMRACRSGPKIARDGGASPQPKRRRRRRSPQAARAATASGRRSARPSSDWGAIGDESADRCAEGPHAAGGGGQSVDRARSGVCNRMPPSSPISARAPAFPRRGPN